MLPILFATAISVAVPATSAAWGTDGHVLITRRALDALPPALRTFLSADASFIVEHSIDPDLWRAMDLSGTLGPEDPNHYFDIDGLDEPRPFSRVPRERRAFLARYGTSRAERIGRLPWQAADVYARLVAAIKESARRPGGASMNARYFVAVLAHYVEDAHVPFHAVLNHDGQLTGQRGIHARFESELVRRYASDLALQPVRVRPIADITDVMFDTIVRSESFVAPVLAADRRAARGTTDYDAAYFRRFFQDTRAVLEDRVSEAASTLASVIVAAWNEAGVPLSGAGRADGTSRGANGRGGRP